VVIVEGWGGEVGREGGDVGSWDAGAGERGAGVLLEARFVMGFGGGTNGLGCSQEGIRGLGNVCCWVRGWDLWICSSVRRASVSASKIARTGAPSAQPASSQTMLPAPQPCL